MRPSLALKAEHARYQNRIDTMYIDKLDGKAEYILKSKNKRAVGVAPTALYHNWLPRPDSNQRPDG